MKHHTAHHQKPAEAGTHENNRASSAIEAGFTASPDEVARLAYFSYLNEGSPTGRDVQHWLEAENQLTRERNQTRIHGFHNQT